MNTYTYDEIYVGLEQEFEVIITEQMMKMFEQLSGDTNPLHVQEEYAISKGFIGRVVYGMLTSALYSRLVGVYLPGENCLLQEIKTSFRKAVYINDKLVIRGKVYSKNDTFKRITIKAWIINEKEEKVSKSEIIVGVLGE